MYIYMYVCVCIYMCVCVSIYTYICMCVYIYIYIYSNIISPGYHLASGLLTQCAYLLLARDHNLQPIPSPREHGGAYFITKGAYPI